LYGGVEQERQIAKLQDGIDILVTTPGRMFDLINQGVIRLNSVDTLVLDEADHMLDLGFIEDIKYVKKMLSRPHQTLFFSATISDEIRKLAYSQVKSAAIRIQVSPSDKVSKNISHAVMFVEPDDKRFFLERMIRENPDSKMIVFVRTKVRAERVVKAMQRAGIEAVNIHGDKDQHERNEAMQQFREGHCRIMVATDVSARGIDIPDVAHVINYDLPEKPENYVHRVGRTGRGVNKGIAISFCGTEEKALLDDIQSFLNKPIEVLDIDKLDYAATIAPVSDDALALKALVDEHDAWLNKKKKKKGKSRKTKR
jgi:ATP-dependent RNA helicase RhlE